MDQPKRPTFFVLVDAEEGDFPYLYLDQAYLESAIEPPDVRDNVYKCVIDSELNLYDCETDGVSCRIVKKGTADEETLRAYLKQCLNRTLDHPRSFRITPSVLDKLDLDELCQIAVPFAVDGAPSRSRHLLRSALIGSIVGLWMSPACGLLNSLTEVGTPTFMVWGAILGTVWGLVGRGRHATSRH